MQRYKDTEIQRYRDTEIQRYKDTEIQRYKDTEIQRYRDTEIQRDTGMIVRMFVYACTYVYPLLCVCMETDRLTD